ncbi:AMP-binding protein [Noviherbaspirillum massiliense]|uniref:AMP-binding protein n=1 Tax=Noviherbaspirillum massiliense TaxID=1465823 RepID=UPI0003783097|nr:AMP-binding protein [Noviherbaspirillum massiliense]
MSHLPTITEQLRIHAESSPDKVIYTFLRDDGKIDEISFKELYDQARELAGRLLYCAEKGSRALLLYPSGLEFIKAYLGCLYAGIVAVPATLPRKARSSQRLTAILKDADPLLILTTQDCIQSVRLSYSSEDLAHRVCMATDAVGVPRESKELPPAANEGIAFLQYTSGSIGTPKGVVVTHQNIVSNVRAIQEAFRFSNNSVMVGWLPLFHDMGLVGGVLSPLYVGFHSVFMSPNTFLKNPFQWLEAISKYRGTCAGAPNFGWDYCIDRVSDDQKKGLDLSCLTVAYNGSEPVRADTLRRFYDAFAVCGLRQDALFPCYGMAEATLFVSGGPAQRPPVVLAASKSALEGNQISPVSSDGNDARHIVSCGQIPADMSVVVVDPETCLPCSRRRVGEIWIAGSSVAQGYWNRPEETEKVFRARLSESGSGPYLRTGDLGFVKDGELFITGRLKDLIIVNGRNIYPQDIEQVIEQSIDFIEPNMAAAFSVEIDNREGLAIVAEANRSLMRAAHLEQKQAADKEGQARIKNEYLAKIDLLASNICKVVAEQFDVSVSTIVFVKPGTFPRTSSGKVQRLRCRQMALNGELDIVYVTSGSILDRRESFSSAPHDVPVPAKEMPVASACAEKGMDDRTLAIAASSKPDSQRSRASADSMIMWFRDYAERRLNSRMMDERRTVPPYVVLDLGNHGFFGLQVPRRFGGCELTTTDLLRVLEQLAGVDLTLALLVGIHNGLGIRPILKSASETMKEQILPGLAAGRELAAFALTEPAAGSNPLAMKASAVRVAGGWLVSAEKQWIGLGAWAGMLTVFAKAQDSEGMPLGTVALAVPENTPGLSQGTESLTMGVRGIVQNTIHLNNAFVPDSALLAEVGEGMAVAQDAMMFSRLGIGAVSVGAMKRCAQLMMRYAMNRTVSTGLLANNPVTLTRLDELASAIYAMESLVHEIAALIDRGEDVPAEAYIACKTSGPELLGEAADRLIQLLGGRGYVESNLAPQLLRDARVLRIFEGPTETLCMHLGASVMRQSHAVVDFMATTLNSLEAADALRQAIDEIRTNANKASLLFQSEAAAEQWIQFQVGQLATAAIVFAATRKRHQDEHGVHGSLQAVLWAKRRFSDLLQSAVRWYADDRPILASTGLLRVVKQYQAAIGDVEQKMAGEEHGVDSLLRREPDASAEDPFRWHAGIANASSIQPGNSIVQASDSPENKSAVFGGGMHSDTVQEQSTKHIIHDCVLKWLYAEKRRKLDKLDYDMPFSQMGMDSLGAVALTVEIERRIGLSLNPEIVYEYQTINDLAPYIDASRSSAAN